MLTYKWRLVSLAKALILVLIMKLVLSLEQASSKNTEIAQFDSYSITKTLFSDC